MNINSATSTRFQEAREMAGLSVGQAAQLLSFSLYELIEVESGKLAISNEQIKRLALFYEVDFEWLSGEELDDGEFCLGDLQIAPRDLEKIKPEELPKLLKILSAIRNRTQVK